MKVECLKNNSNANNNTLLNNNVDKSVKNIYGYLLLIVTKLSM